VHDALQIARQTILDFYIAKTEELIWRLTSSTLQAKVSPQLLEL
jgi:phosphoenolpyruvate carboxylase